MFPNIEEVTIRSNSLDRENNDLLVKPISHQATEAFSAYYPKFIAKILEEFPDMTPSDLEQLKEMLDYNLLFGHKRMPYVMLSAYYEMEKPEHKTVEKLDLVNLMAWCIHLTRASFQMLDDIADGTQTRSGRPTWHQKIGKSGVIDGLLLWSLVPSLVRKHFSTHKHYSELLELHYQLLLKSCIGERIQFSTCSWDEKTVERWMKITYNKTSWSLVEPFKIAMFLTETYDEEKFENMKPILLDFGLLLQIINDHADVFPIENMLLGNPTDIKDGICSWLMVNALKLANPSQRRLIEENCGQEDEESVKKVEDVYIELGLKNLGEQSRDRLYQDIIKRIDDLPQDYPKQALKNGLLIVYECY